MNLQGKTNKSQTIPLGIKDERVLPVHIRMVQDYFAFKFRQFSLTFSIKAYD